MSNLKILMNGIITENPTFVFYLVVDKEACETFVVDEFLLGQEFHVSGDGIFGQFPLLHLVADRARILKWILVTSKSW